jgi:hypothetical protein
MVRDGFIKIYDIINNRYGYRLMKENVKFEMIGKKSIRSMLNMKRHGDR